MHIGGVDQGIVRVIAIAVPLNDTNYERPVTTAVYTRIYGIEKSAMSKKDHATLFPVSMSVLDLVEKKSAP